MGGELISLLPCSCPALFTFLVLDFGWRIEEILFQSHLGILFNFLLNWISVSVNCFSSTFFAIYISFAIVLVGSGKALRSRLGFLVSWVLRFGFPISHSLFTVFMLIYSFVLRSGFIQDILYFSVCCNFKFPCLISANPTPHSLYNSSHLHFLHFKILQFTFLAF